MHIPDATYRIQFTQAFGFKDAKNIIDYLATLGISDVYASPIFKARKGSTHGYDVVNPNCINPELGQHSDFQRLIDTLHAYSMGWLQDIVPNHMAYDTENMLLMDVLESGADSEYFGFFDIEWNHPYEHLKGRIIAPFLKKCYADVLTGGEITLTYDEAGFHLNYAARRFPLRIESYAAVLEHNIENLEQRFSGNKSEFIRFLGSLQLFKNIVTSSKNGKSQQIQHAKKMLWSLYNEQALIREFINENICMFNGCKSVAGSFNALESLISRQLYRLSFWKVAAEEINYRRFFAVNDLISMRVEKENVFAHTHELTCSLVQKGSFNGLRVDHVDGLSDPTAYLKRLREKIGDVYIVVEKILGPQENMPASWPVQGTTGYDFMFYVNNLFCCKDNEIPLSKIYHGFTNYRTFYEDLSFQKKWLIIEKHFTSTIDSLAQRIKKLSMHDRYGHDITLHGIRRALMEVASRLPVYRTYITGESLTEEDRSHVNEAVRKAKAVNPDLLYELSFIEKFLLLQYDASLDEEEKKQWIHVVMAFQQNTGPLMAKGIEDTCFYIYNRLISLNEIGGHPDIFGLSIQAFHDFNKKRMQRCSLSLNATSTHDTKRGEDVRARLNVLSEIPLEWGSILKTFSRINRRAKQKIDGWTMPDENIEYFLYQTLIGIWPFNAGHNFIQRIKDYVIKALREAKVHTTWLKPDNAYENACSFFIEKIMYPSRNNPFLKKFLPFQKKVALFGIFNSLSQTILKATCPGVPDFYQGSELWELNLVDPDNRRPVDFEKRKAILDYIQKKAPVDMQALLSEILSTREDGRIKLFLIYQILQVRKQHRELFQSGSYVPVPASGKFANHIIAFARTLESTWALTIAPRFLTGIIRQDELPLGRHVWADTSIQLPDKAPAFWKDCITGRQVPAGKPLRVGDILKHFPVALLVHGETP